MEWIDLLLISLLSSIVSNLILFTFIFILLLTSFIGLIVAILFIDDDLFIWKFDIVLLILLSMVCDNCFFVGIENKLFLP